MSKIHDINRHFVNNDGDILGLVETFLKSNDRPVKFYKKIVVGCKYRKTNSCNGGIGMCMESNITVLDDNLLNSKDDTLERCGCSCD
jgi:hypothetical protein